MKLTEKEIEQIEQEVLAGRRIETATIRCLIDHAKSTFGLPSFEVAEMVLRERMEKELQAIIEPRKDDPEVYMGYINFEVSAEIVGGFKARWMVRETIAGTRYERFPTLAEALASVPPYMSTEQKRSASIAAAKLKRDQACEELEKLLLESERAEVAKPNLPS